MNLDSNEIISEIKDFDIVTFDVFDTLLVRDVVSYRDFVYLMRKKYKHETGNNLPFMFFRRRVHAPKPAVRKFGVAEASINDIYNVLNIADRELIKNIELNTEIDVIEPNPEMKKVYDYCVCNNKKICCISDMYLKKEHIKSLLDKCGYCIDDVYVSQEYGTSKASGGLFREFLKKEMCSPDKVVHIGDNFGADVKGAQLAGIHAVHIDRNPGKLKYSRIGRLSGADKRILYKFINNKIDGIEGGLERTGYEVIGPVLYYFVDWLCKTLKENNLEQNVLFCSRDGYLIREAYRTISENEVERPNVRRGYIRVSKKSVENACSNKKSEKYNAFRGYMESCGFKGKSTLVDIGWSGRLHKMIAEAMKDRAQTFGFYFGAFKEFYKNVPDGISKGWLNLSKNKMAQVYMNAGFIEQLFADTVVGTTLGYEEHEGKYEAVCSAGSPNGNMVRKLQSGALRFVRDFSDSAVAGYLENISQNVLVDPLLEFCFNPTDEDFNSLCNEYYGKAEEYEHLVVAPTENDLAARLKGLKDACWKGGYMRTGFGNNRLFKMIYKNLNAIRLMLKV